MDTELAQTPAEMVQTRAEMAALRRQIATISSPGPQGRRAAGSG